MSIYVLAAGSAKFPLFHVFRHTNSSCVGNCTLRITPGFITNYISRYLYSSVGILGDDTGAPATTDIVRIYFLVGASDC